MRRFDYILIPLIILASFGLGIYFYPQMPALMASHWNFKGEVDDYLPRFWGLFLMPLVSVFLAVLFYFIPKIDPLKENVAKFRRHFNNFVILILLFLFYLYLLTIAWNLGYHFDMGRCLLPALALVFYYSGVLIEKTKRNWFIGIRTPWTLSNDKVWAKTHRLGGKLFKISSLIALLGLLFPQIAFYLVILPVVFFSLFLVLYSYRQFRNLSCLIIFFLFFFLFPGKIKAWGGDVHSYLCPGSYDCSVADSREFKTTYQWDNWGHLCLDNQPDCLARLGAKYFLERYYLESKKDWKLLAAAAHFYQDASCPDHWYPMREFFGKIIVPFAPAWVNKVENDVSKSMFFRPQPGDKRDSWNIPIEWHGQQLNINKAYLDQQKEALQQFVSQEPKEDLTEIQRQIGQKRTLTLIRSFKEISYLIILVLLPVWLYTLWAWKKKSKKGDFLITSSVLLLLILYLLFLQLFW